MKVQILAVGNKQAEWINTAYENYAKRLKQDIVLELKEIPTVQNKNLTATEIKKKEAELILTAIPKNSRLIALDQHGKQFTTESLAKAFQESLNNGDKLSLVIGGAEGLDQSILDQADQRWSLSNLTLPHGLVRVLISEQIYRAWTILKCHPYHRS